MKIGLIGDRILDIYVHGTYGKFAQEFPIPVFCESSKTQLFGGSENVERNLRAFGNDVVYKFDPNIKTKKTRYVINNHLIFRTDDDYYIANPITEFDFDSDVRYVILSDYNKGFLHHSKSIINNLKKQNKFIIVDPKKQLDAYVGANIVKLNESEFREYSDETDYQKALNRYELDTIIITRAEKSVILVERDNIREIEIDNHQICDVTGAGDVFIASFTHYLASNYSTYEATLKATKLASLSVTKFGSYVLTEDDIRSITPKVIFTNGCFDILHSGHIEYLKQSRKLGDKLIVGLNSDSSVRRLKGETRPLNSEHDRKKVLESLECVDEVIIFDEDTPYELIKTIKPAIITKGGDYTIETVVGHDLADVVIIPFVEGYSTTKILEKL